MNLYRIMLVDDEEEVRESIIKKIDWAAAGFQVVGDAENGEDALEKLENLETDVLLTDIRMPYMDGLTLTEKVKQRYPSVKVVIFSGFDDFEYAQKAIKLNVTEYILKPVNVEELTAILKKLKASLDEEIEQKRNVNILRESYRNSLPIIREHFLNDMIHGIKDREEINRKLTEYGIDILGAKRWIAAVVDVERTGRGEETLSFHQETELIPISVRKILEEKLENYCRFTIFNYSTEMVLIAAIDETNTKTGLFELLGDICRECTRILEVKVTIGIGRSCTDLPEIKRSFQTAQDALGYRAIVGEGSVIYINDVEPVGRGKLQFSSQEESELIAAIKFGPREKIERTVLAIVEKMDDAKVHIRQHQAYILSVINTVIQIIQQYNLNITEMFGSDRDYFEIIGSLQRWEDLCQWLTESALRINLAISEERTNTTKNVIQEAKEYIEENYHDPELSVEKICRYLHMSPAYFSTMFKKETGQAYIAYLTDIRLKKAVELLNKTDDKTYVIAAKVGYQEQNYFSYVFKKKFGVSPTRYRGVK